MEAAARYQQWWPFHGEGGDDQRNWLRNAERGYEDLREAYDNALSQAVRARRRGCCLLRDACGLAWLATDSGEENGDDDKEGGDDDEGDEAMAEDYDSAQKDDS
jgi:hypothetical protein